MYAHLGSHQLDSCTLNDDFTLGRRKLLRVRLGGRRASPFVQCTSNVALITQHRFVASKHLDEGSERAARNVSAARSPLIFGPLFLRPFPWCSRTENANPKSPSMGFEYLLLGSLRLLFLCSCSLTAVSRIESRTPRVLFTHLATRVLMALCSADFPDKIFFLRELYSEIDRDATQLDKLNNSVQMTYHDDRRL